MTTTHEHHEHYDHYNENMIERLDGLYGEVEKSINKKILDHIYGKRILDVGCGFGSLVNFLQQNHFEVLGIDQHALSINAGRKKFPEANLRLSSGTFEEFSENAFDTVIMKDVIHHVYEEDDAEVFLNQIKRISAKRLIIVDPNPTWILKLCRKIIGHIDPICSPQEARKLLNRCGYTVQKIFYSEVIAFPLSGGYVGKEFIHSKLLTKIILNFEKIIASLIESLKLSSFLCWRYYIVADKVEKE